MNKGLVGIAALVALLASASTFAQATGPDGRPFVPGQFQAPPASPSSVLSLGEEDIEQQQREEITRIRRDQRNHDINLTTSMKFPGEEKIEFLGPGPLEGSPDSWKLPALKISLDAPKGERRWVCSNPLDLEAYCGDEDGCNIDVIIQRKGSVDEVLRITEQVTMENRRTSENRDPGTYGYTRQGGAGDELKWTTGKGDHSIIFQPWTSFYGFNYLHEYCTKSGQRSPAFAFPYNFSFLVRPEWSAVVVVND
jgi:hypothetical protein